MPSLASARTPKSKPVLCGAGLQLPYDELSLICILHLHFRCLRLDELICFKLHNLLGQVGMLIMVMIEDEIVQHQQTSRQTTFAYNSV
jgi:hypothetical protein